MKRPNARVFRLAASGFAQEGFSEDGWAGVADDTPAWTSTVEATWTPPRMDWAGLAGDGLLALLCVVATVGMLAGGRGLGVLLLSGLALLFGRDAWQRFSARRPRAPLKLALAPDRLQLTSTLPNFTPVVLERGQAGWLVAQEYGLDWHNRWLTVGDHEGREAVFMGSLAEVLVKASADDQVEPRRFPTKLPVAVLLGAWWPHPARRMSRQGNMNLAFHWREPDIEGFPRRERLERMLLSACIGLFAALLWCGALSPTSPLIGRGALGVPAAALTLAIVRVLLWRPQLASCQG